MIQFVTKGKKNPINKTIRFYAQIAPVEAVSLDDIVAEIEHSTTLSEADIKATLVALQYHIIRHITGGRAVRLGDLGSFRPTMTSRGVTEAKDVTAAQISSVRCRFTPSARMKKELQTDRLRFCNIAPVRPAEPEGV